jgi:hypothetical protein
MSITYEEIVFTCLNPIAIPKGENMLKYTKKVVLMGKKTQICDE